MKRWSEEQAQAVFWSRVRKSEGCWIWIGSRFHNSGYGRFKFRSRDTNAHIFSWEWEHGPVPDGLELDHLCRNRACVRPSHLEPVTHRENELRGATVIADNYAKTHCSAGHPLSGENLFIRRDGRRRCRTCELATQKRLRATDDYRAKHAAYERVRKDRIRNERKTSDSSLQEG